MRKITGAGCLAGLFLAGIAQADVPAYATLELQARTNLLVNDNGWNLPPGSSFNSISASLNDDAQVAFTVGIIPDGSDSHPGLWSGAHAAGSLVFEAPSGAGISSESRSMSPGASCSRCATRQCDACTSTIRSPDRKAHQHLAVIPNSYSSPDINSAGALGYQAVFSSGRALASTLGANTQIHVGDAGVSPGSPYTYIYTPAFDDQRRIASKVATSPDFFTQHEIRLFAADGNSTLILANQATDPLSPYARFDNGLSVNANGTVAVVAVRAADNRRVIVRSDGTTTTEIAAVDPAGTIRDIEFFAPAINAGGLVAFRARDAIGQAIYVGDGTNLVRVVGQSTAVATDLGAGQVGQHDSSPIFAGKPDINVHGDIAFVAGLHPAGDNGEEWGSGVFVAYADRDSIFADGFEPALP